MKRMLVCLLFAIAPLTAVAAQHSVALSGCSSTSPGVQYNIYRGTAPGAESSTPLNATPLTTCAFTDTTVVGAHTYYYVAKATCTTCFNGGAGLSGPSNEVSGLIPSDAQPNAPTGLTLGAVAGLKVPMFWNAPTPQADFTVASYYINKGATSTSQSRYAIVSPDKTSFTDKKCKGTCFYNVQARDANSAGQQVTSNSSNLVLVVN